METQTISIPAFALEWSDWHTWTSLLSGAGSGGMSVVLPIDPGVYEVKYADIDERLHIGKASNLRMRVKQGLVKGKIPHSSGTRIRNEEDTSRIVIRWSRTDRPSAAEEELHLQHLACFGRLPKQTKRT